MAARKFALGARVHLSLGRYAESNPTDIYTISRMLPAEANIWQYRVKRVSDGQERTVSEPMVVAVQSDSAAAERHEKTVGAQQDLRRMRNEAARARARPARYSRL